MSSVRPFHIAGRVIDGAGVPFVIAEISANHGGSLESALAILRSVAKCGADAVKFQHYKPETITIRSDLPDFRVGGGTLWDGRQLFDLYSEAMTPWEWTEALFEEARRLGLVCFSTPFDESAVDFLEDFEPAAYKVASFELTDLPLIRYIASKGRPVIMSTGMATLEEIDAAVDAALHAGCGELALLRCNSGYPAEPSEMDLAAIPFMRDRYRVQVGLSDHTLSSVASVAAVALGATLIEKHVIESRGDGGPDAAFSSEPAELGQLIVDARIARSAIGLPRFGPSERELSSIRFRRSLRATRKLHPGDRLTKEDFRSMRPAGGLSPDLADSLLGRVLTREVEIGSPILWDLFE